MRLSEPDRKLIYMAAMKPFGEESERRIRRHREQRSGLGFETVEAYTDIDRAVRFMENSDATVLLECLPNLLANELFDDGGNMMDSRLISKKIRDSLNYVSGHVKNLIVVTNEIGSDGIDYKAETGEYVKTIGELNDELAAAADCVIEVVYAVPLFLKGII